MSSHLTRDVLFRGSTVECRPENDPPRCKRTFRLILLGPPGVGKGTQAEMLCRKLQTCHVSTGDLFRAAQCQETPSPAMAAALEVMRRGELVPDELVMSVVQERLRSLRADEGFLLDGVPRTIEQAKGLADLLGDAGLSIDAVLHYELPIKEVVNRIAGRRTCTECKAVYHVTSRPPSSQDVCDHCGSSLMQRDDDRSEAVCVRMEAYREVTQPLTNFYAARGMLIRISADGRPDEILERTLSALEKHPRTKVG